MNFNWMSNPQYLAQIGHFLGGALLITIATLFSVVLGAGWNPILITLGIGVGAATYKEFVFDTSLLKNLPVIGKWAFFQGEGDSWSDSLMDWSFYMLGGGIGMGISLARPPPGDDALRSLGHLGRCRRSHRALLDVVTVTPEGFEPSYTERKSAVLAWLDDGALVRCAGRPALPQRGVGQQRGGVLRPLGHPCVSSLPCAPSSRAHEGN